MKDRRFIDQAKVMLDKEYTDDSIIYYLKEAGAEFDSIPSIIEIAKVEYLEQRSKRITIKNKFSYYLWLVLTISTFITFLFILPLFDIGIGHIFILSLLGSTSCCFFALHTWSYRKTWEEKFVQTKGRPTVQYGFLIILFVPAVILHFVFSLRFSSVQDNVLKNTQIEVVGHIIDGSSVEVKRVLRGGGIDVSTITVQFETKEGQKLAVTKDVSTYQFQKFYKGQEVQLIYSKSNPRNIDLLADESSIRNFKNTQERELEPTDLFHLLSINKQNISDELNKISYGWKYNPTTNMWVNEKRQSAITINPNELHLIGNQEYNLSYPLFLNRHGFTMTNKEDPDDIMHTGKKIYENKQFIFNVEAKVNQYGGNSIISVIRK